MMALGVNGEDLLDRIEVDTKNLDNDFNLIGSVKQQKISIVNQFIGFID